MNKNAFTLIEVIIAMAILVIGVIGLMQVFPVGIKASKASGVKSDVALIAQKILEETKAVGIENMPSELEEGDFICELSAEKVSVEGSQLPVDQENLSVPYKVELTVNWAERSRTRSETFITYIMAKQGS